ncbi:ATP-dependent RNA helicase HrpA [Nesterenkonia xinjiangensis]|uniref:RNA helicase n=2 Tax=Nesterenkonia xinjiangensis TaxID=225327 RepID=A0A7Z0K9Y9_9MICC|nr:ATP-dependent RNA helicase HrpA [Nesterenkonia xinjiangensis]NYJ79234.1 ATP-dependent helicase HrpA [Nesterenkonia xinjiangensis]
MPEPTRTASRRSPRPNAGREGGRSRRGPERRSFTAEDLNYPDELPVTGEREIILEALREHQVVVVAGETGSGKTTQLPKMCLELGLQRDGIIGHTQPRRLAARTVAERLAEELGTGIGEDIGYQVRFTSEVSEASSVKLMTDGILLTELRRDPMLRRYSAILIDEAHERSLNIDVILGYLKSILPKRPELKVIITSATIDPERFATHFSPDPDEPTVPIIEVSGRTFPVEVRYRSLRPDVETSEQDAFDEDSAGAGSSEERDMIDAVGDAVLELAEEPDGDMLVFFPGEREIRDAADALADVVRRDRRLADAEILPLFGRLSLAEQKRVFSPGGRRRIVLATNVAETSLTVPGIKYVIDTGTARISRYSTRTKVQRLPIEAISQASANQRAGRCGRTSDGICIRLYSQGDFESRPEFTDPEILRTSLASVLLQMSSMGITRTPEDLLDFPFVQPPDAKAVTDAVRLLTELGALHTGGKAPGGGARRSRQGEQERRGSITPVGRALAQLPVDPRLGRMMVEAGRRDCLEEVTVLVAGLSIQDPRERPAAVRQQADEMHRRFADDASDFSALLNLWQHLLIQQQELSGNQFRKMCRREHLNYLRVREWQDLVVQLADLARQADLGPITRPRRRSQMPVEPAARHDAVHRSLLSGLLSHIGLYSPRTRDYQGARGTRFAVFPGSGLFKRTHDWIMAAELVETSRLWARTAARIDPTWIEELAPHLVKRTHSEPRWSARQGAAVATEKVTLYGVPVVADRQVLFGRIDAEQSRELFIRRALVEGDWTTRHHFDRRNRERFQEIEELENRTRRRDLRASDDMLFAFFDERLPQDITSQRHFDSWWKNQRHETPELLDLTEDHVLGEGAEAVDVEAFPEHLDLDGLRLELRYEFNPDSWSRGEGRGTTADGVTVRVPILFLNQLRPTHFDWLIPGLRTELITQLIRSMPKQLRKNFVPAPDVAAQARTRLEQEFVPGEDPLAPSLATVLQRLRGERVDPEALDLRRLPAHLRFTYAVLSERGRVLDSSQDLEELQLRFAQQNREAISRSLAGGGKREEGRPGSPQGSRGAASVPPQAMPGSSGRSGRSGRHQHAAEGPGTETSAGASPVPAQREQTSWTFGDLPRELSRGVGGREVTGYPALAEEQQGRRGVHCTIQDSAADQHRVHRRGVVALLREVLPSPQRYVVDHLSNRERLAFGRSPHGTVESLVTDCTTAALDHLVPAELPFSAVEFEQVAREARAELIETVLSLTDVLAKVLTASAQLGTRLDSAGSAALQPAVSDMRAQLEVLVHPGFVAATGQTQMRHLPRYLQAMALRLDRLEAGQGLTKDAQDMALVQKLEDEYDTAIEAVPDQLPVPEQLAGVKWMLEELRVNLFAQQLGTAQTVSAKRIRRAITQGSR